MKFYVRIDGKLVEATPEQMKDLKVELYFEDGAVARKGEAPPVQDDVVGQLAKAVTDLTKKVTDMSVPKADPEKDALKAEVEALKKAVQKGFPLASVGDQASAAAVEDWDTVKNVIAPFDLNYQGKRLMDKIHHPHSTLSDKGRLELAKFLCLVVKAGAQRIPNIGAIQAFDKFYPGIRDGRIKTAVGDGGNAFPIPDIVEAEILAFARESSVTLQYARIWDMTSEYQSWPKEDTAVSVNWGNETGESEPGITEFQLTAQELSAYAVVKNMTLADARSDIVSWLTEAMSEAVGLELDNKAFNGVGADETFVCSGILSAACGYSVTMGVGSTAFSQLDSADLSSMIAKLDGMRKMGARFWMNGAIMHFVRNLRDEQNRPIFIETVGSPVSGTIWGYPYTEVIKCPSTTGAATPFMAFGNMRYFGVGRRLDAGALSVDPYGLWHSNRTRFKIYSRWGLGMALPKGFVRYLTHS